MPSQPLTPAGVTAKTTELYALSNALLAAQADAVESNFRSWIAANFTLSTSQSDYLDRIDDHAAKYYGAQCSVAFRSRLAVSLTIGPDPGPGSSKWIVSQDSLITSTNDSGALETIGSLAFKFEYRS